MEAQKALVEQVKAALGPERGAEYERSIDNNFQSINRVVQRLELPKEAAVSVWNLQKEAEQRMTALQQDRSLPPAARTAQYAALAQEMTAKVTDTIGQRGLDVYKQYGGSWLQNIQARANITTRTVPSGTGEMIFSPR
jgi:lipase chaperone LimK